jgi:transposase
MDMSNTSLIVLAWELFNQGMPKSGIALNLGKNRETIHLWISGIQKHGLKEHLNLYESAKKGKRTPKKANHRVKQWIYDIRERELDCCGQKIAYFLQKERNVHLSVPKIYQILAEKYVIRSKWKKNKQRGPVPHPESPGEVIQMDTIDFGEIFAFTGVDCFTREVHVMLAPALNSEFGHIFLKQSMKIRFNSHAKLIQTDGGPEFKDNFKQNVLTYCDRHRISRPYRKNEQSYIESFNRTVRKECLGWIKYKVDELEECNKMVESFLERYHYHRPHMGLGMRPPLTRT